MSGEKNYVDANGKPLKFTWDGNEQLRDEVAKAGARYYIEAGKITGPNRAKKLFGAVADHNLGANEEMKPFYDAYKAYDDLKAKCCNDHRIVISLVSFTAVPEGEEFSKQRDIRQKEYENAKNHCKRRQ